MREEIDCAGGVSVELSSLERAQQKNREMREEGMGPERFDPIEKARRNPTSLRLAINAHCWDCISASHHPNPRPAIRDCGIVRCPLHPVRPYQNVKG